MPGKAVGNKRGTKKIANSNHLRNTKYRRTKNLVKKSVEISNQCNLDFVIIIYDPKFNRFKEVHTNRDITFEKVHTMINGCQDPFQLNGSKQPVLDLSHKYKRVYARDLVEVDDDEAGADEDDQET